MVAIALSAALGLPAWARAGTTLDPARIVAQSPAPAITIQQAITKATAAVPGGRVIKMDLDREKGRVIWEALVESPTGRFEIYVDATTGQILKKERDY
ncbi:MULTISPECIES: PepSY domain-containing protein [unclassified Cyanobium]|uniref:PepSY domain-containing protein n=1 Tax=unclassified Cyanobium TaxID=2627006 RepID=UPI0020CF6793|nr:MULTISPECIES: PepSY domain-containing protein [unclassified Cyanobium]MCP9832845.1 PepSY domain-containing protein [Cyanobium sp. La Preciosa 7G6]MCP9935595.1 PepSY domain-containing protein [Cyanobium sp. Aljojuca 7A6]